MVFGWRGNLSVTKWLQPSHKRPLPAPRAQPGPRPLCGALASPGAFRPFLPLRPLPPPALKKQQVSATSWPLGLRPARAGRPACSARGSSSPCLLAVPRVEDQPHRQVGGRVARAGLPRPDSVLRRPKRKRPLAEVVPVGKAPSRSGRPWGVPPQPLGRIEECHGSGPSVTDPRCLVIL